MLRIEREAVRPDVFAIASLVDRPFALMTIAAERAQRPEHERVPVPFMGRAMICDAGRRKAIPLKTERT
jgi:hypothetical protein